LSLEYIAAFFNLTGKKTVCNTLLSFFVYYLCFTIRLVIKEVLVLSYLYRKKMVIIKGR